MVKRKKDNEDDSKKRQKKNEQPPEVETDTGPNQTNNLIEENNEIEQKDVLIKQLEEENEVVVNKLSEEQKRSNELEKTKSKLENDYNKLHKEKEEQHNKLENEKNELIKEIEILKSSHEANDEINSLQQQLKEKVDDLNALEEKNTELRKEASKYQSALGNATNTRLGDEDSVKFRQDILDLQKTLENYVTNLKPNMDINNEQVKILAEKYGCLSPIDSKSSKPFIKALLQRKVLDDILESAKQPSDEGDVKLEMGIESKAQELLDLIEKFSTSRTGTDEVVKVAAIKVRQQVYGILGNRGFADVIGPNGSHVHDFIKFVSDNLNNTMNQYRIIKDEDKRKEVESIAPKLIQDIYKLFFYLLNVQEPKVRYKFCESGSKIDPTVMKGRWDEDDIPQLCVDICCFPMIGRDLDSPNWKIYTQAKVYPRQLSE